ncbi:hypothetical protein CR205_18690 [Alteribacter lacisalsi]|uniref:Uncharacterized protein n=1 Tax=Alteribacter lacisalsi TaxID=2045244 RepID=A0A2W0HPQ6_9BACI|nr:hypothetical protein [Alteribacter lacisalsi]PYZ95558.1 hypothetical protein CR205_18690 [Alteribacter lacisalsi]
MKLLAGLLLTAGVVSLWIFGLVYPAWLENNRPEITERKRYIIRGAAVAVALVCFFFVLLIVR